MKTTLTADDNYFEAFTPGDRFRHWRGKTVTEWDNVNITHMVMNSAEGHFNEHKMQATDLGERITFGGITSSIVIGLAMQDTGENVERELKLDGIRLRTPVLHGDTLYAYTEVLEAEVESERLGRVRFRHTGVNQRDEIVFEGEREVLMLRAPQD